MAGRSNTEFSAPRNKFVHQIFLSFRGEDVRKRFIGHLFNALQTKGFRVFIDNDGLEHGKDIQRKLFEAIKNSKLSIVTLSPRYAESRWCLDELAEIMELNVSPDRSVLPVFFDVEPTDVRHQTGLNKTFFDAHEKRFEGDIGRVQSWRWALKGIADLKGPSLKDTNGDEAQLVENIINEVRKILAIQKLEVPRNIVGVDSIVGDIRAWIRDGSEDVDVGVIHGQGGIGKTTIAQIVFNANCNYFDRSCFLGDIRRVLGQDRGLLRLQRKLILDISQHEAGEIYNVSEGMAKVRDAIGPWKILLVLDDVEEMAHLSGLFDHPEWFCPGSKIIITTRNRQLRKVHLFQCEFKVSVLNEDESTKLFSLHAFGQNYPLEGFEELSQVFVNYCGGLPLALRVLASMLHEDIDLEIWEDRLHKLERYPNPSVHQVLKLSFDSLKDEDDRNLFLHIAFFFVGRPKQYTITVLKACGVYTKAGFQNLTNRCLVSGDKFLWMHQLILEMGREVVRNEAETEPGLRSRLWDHNDTLNMLRKNKGTSAVKGLRLAFPVPECFTVEEEIKTQSIASGIGLASVLPPSSSKRVTSHLESLNTDAFTKLDNLNLLELSYVQLKGEFLDIPKEIKWLYWQGCPLEVLPQDMELYELSVLDVQNSQLSKVWEDAKLLGALKILDLSYSCSLRSTPNFSNANGLERIILEGCISLVQIHDSIGSLTRLTHLNLKGCKKLRRIPNTVKKLHSIRKVDLSGCPLLFTVPTPMESSIILAGNRNSQSQILAPLSSLGLFRSIVELKLSNCGLSSDAFLDSLSCSSSSLRELDLSRNPIKEITKDLRPFTQLHHVTLDDCKNLRSVSLLPMSVNLLADSCISLERIEYQKNPYPKNVEVYANFCPKLVEIGGFIKIEPTTEMDGNMAKYMGFSKLHSTQCSPLITADGTTGDFNFSKGVYECGIYSVFLHGDHIIEDWFSVTEPGSEILYTIPLLPDHPVRAFNVSCVYGCSRYSRRIEEYVEIENLTTMCKWCYVSPISHHTRFLVQGFEMTWLSHWSVMPHRDVRAGDQLKVSFQGCGVVPLKCGINIVYEVDDGDFDFETGSQVNGDIASAYHDAFRATDLSEFEKPSESITIHHGLGCSRVGKARNLPNLRTEKQSESEMIRDAA